MILNFETLGFTETQLACLVRTTTCILRSRFSDNSQREVRSIETVRKMKSQYNTT